jgi:predicted Abi (CAAX) family protease
MLSARLADLAAALAHLPSPRVWARGALELLWALPLLLVVAHLGGIIRWNPPEDATTLFALGATLFLAPALGEELLFRGLLIPRHRPSWQWIGLSALLFVLWHPLQAITFGPPWAGSFLNPCFLLSVAILGVALGRIYAATRSIWPCVAAHWLVVFGWKALLGAPF